MISADDDEGNIDGAFNGWENEGKTAAAAAAD